MNYIIDKDGYVIGRTERPAGGTVVGGKLPYYDGDMKIRYNAGTFEFVSYGDYEYRNNGDFCRNYFSLLAIFQDAVMFEPGTEVFGKDLDTPVSVLIPCYMKSDYIIETVASVVRQSVKAAEIIVLLMDGESAGRKKELEAMAENVRCIECDRLDIIESRNRLVELCTTDWFVLFDADDIMAEDMIECLLRTAPCAVAFPLAKKYCDGTISNMGKSVLKPKNDPSHALGQNLTSLMHKRVFRAVGLDREFCDACEDTDFIIRLLMSDFKVVYCDAAWYGLRRDTTDGFVSSSVFAAANGLQAKRLLQKHRKVLLERFRVSDDLLTGLAADILNNGADGDSDALYCFADRYGCYGTLKFLSDVLRKDLYPKIVAAMNRSSDNVYPGSGYRVLSSGEVRNEDIFPDLIEGRNFDVLFLYTKRSHFFTDYITTDYSCIINRRFEKTLSKKLDDGFEFFLECLEKGKVAVSWHDCRKNRVASWEEAVAFAKKFIPVSGERARAVLRFFENGSVPEVRKRTVQPVAFVLDKKCDRRCAYCPQDKSEEVPVPEAEQIRRIKKYLAVYKKNWDIVSPMFLGGEPGLWSDYLWDGIIEATRGFPKVTIFTNGLCFKNKKLLEVQNFFFWWHFIDWKSGSCNDYDLPPNSAPMIVCTRQDIPFLAGFLERFPGRQGISVAPCHGSADPSMDCGIDDIAEIDGILQRYGNFCLSEYVDAFRANGGAAVREFCRSGVCSHQIEVNTDEISPCCACRTKVAVPGDAGYLWLKNIRETEANCKDCLIIDEFRNSHL